MRFLVEASYLLSTNSGIVVNPCLRYLGSNTNATNTSTIPEPASQPITLKLLRYAFADRPTNCMIFNFVSIRPRQLPSGYARQGNIRHWFPYYRFWF